MAATNEDIIWAANLNTQQVVQALNNIQQEIQNTTRQSDQNFNQIGGSANQLASVLSGAVAGAVTALTQKFIEMASQAVSALKEIADRGVELNAELEQSKIVFTNLLGDPEQAEALLDQIKEKANEVGLSFQDAQRFGASLLPDVQNYEQFYELLKVIKIGASDSGKSMDELNRAFNEVAGGQYESIKDILDIPGPVIARMKEGSSELGNVGAAVRELQGFYDKKGIGDISTFADTYATNLSKIEAAQTDLTVALGEPIFDVMKESMVELNTILEENNGDFTLIANSVGLVVASITDFINTNFNEWLASLDTENVMILLDSLYGTVEVGQLLITVMGGLQSSGEATNESLSGLAWLMDKLSQTMITLTQITAMVNASVDALGAAYDNLRLDLEKFGEDIGLSKIGEGFNQLQKDLGLDQLGGDFEKLADTIERRDPFEVFNESMLESAAAFEQYNQDMEEQNTKLEEFEQAVNEAVEPLNEFSDSLLGQKAALQAAQDAMAEYEDAVQKIGEAESKINLKRECALEDLMVDATNKRIDIEIAAQRKREDLEEKHMQRVADIHRKFQSKIEDAQAELGQGLADLMKEHAREQEEIDRELADNRISIEQSYRERLQDIRDQFNLDAEEAIRERDAIALLRLARKAEQDVAEAQKSRDRELQDAELAAQQKREQSQRELEQEMADFEEQQKRKIAQLKKQYQEELKLAEEKRKEEAAAIDKEEQRKLEDLDRWIKRRREKIETQYKRDKEDMSKKLAAEVDLVKNFEKEKTQATIKEIEARIAELQKEIDKRKELQQMGGSGSSRRTGRRVQSGGSQGGGDEGSDNPTGPVMMASGGNLRAGQPAIVGEEGPELIVPQEDVKVYNNNELMRMLSGGEGSAGKGSGTEFDPSKSSDGSSMFTDLKTNKPRIINKGLGFSLFKGGGFSKVDRGDSLRPTSLDAILPQMMSIRRSIKYNETPQVRLDREEVLRKLAESRQFGGPVSGGEPYLVGEDGPELIVPNSSGNVIPNDRLMLGEGIRPSGSSGNVTNNNNEINVGLSTSDMLSQEQMYIIEQMIINAMREGQQYA